MKSVLIIIFIISSTISLTKGIHIVLPSYYAPEGIGLVDMSTSDGRFLFLLPWQVRGQTDFDFYTHTHTPLVIDCFFPYTVYNIVYTIYYILCIGSCHSRDHRHPL